MTTNTKNFKVKNGLTVEGNEVILGTAPISFNSTNNKLQIFVSEQWIDISDSNDISFMDMGLAIDYDGNPTYIVQANGVNPGATSKFVDGGSPETTSFVLTFDASTVS